MQFVRNGPDIPDALLQAHEDERVVFFCGAGISNPAGLPNFQGLVDAIYKEIGTDRRDIEHEAYKRYQFDATLDLLERRMPGQRQNLDIRKALAKILKPKLRRVGATSTHRALLQLAHDRKHVLRLVTTNFDRIFEVVSKQNKNPCRAYVAPMLPIPKKSRWNGVVYLHGLLPEKPNEDDLRRLVLTSGDFGLAYLVERWAARFVSELLRNYIVCFIGYSISDPVLRYMMDALAADRMLGESTPMAYAFGDYESDQSNKKRIEWEAKGVIPILYEANSRDHSALHNTLIAWAKAYRDGGKEQIVIDYALARPTASTTQDDFVGRMLWALSDKSGAPAKRFAEFNPPPSLEWLEVFSENRFKHSDLNRFEVMPCTEFDKNLAFGLVQRPTPYKNAPWMALASMGNISSEWDEVMRHLAQWLLRYLNDPQLIIWIAQQGGQLHDNLARLIDHELDRFAKLQNEGNTDAINEILKNSPNAIPDKPMRKLWHLLLTKRIGSPRNNFSFYEWKNQVEREGLTVILRFKLRELLAPKVNISKPSPGYTTDIAMEASRALRQRASCKLILASTHIRSEVMDLTEGHWQEITPLLVNDLESLLRDALDLKRELEETDDDNDNSHWGLPSISPHYQNRGFEDWVVLIELLRDAWLALRNKEPARAARIAKSWFELPYSTFKRLALFAASLNDCINSAQWVAWLADNNVKWLWSTETQREVTRLLVLQGNNLTPQAQEKLEAAILGGWSPEKTFELDNPRRTVDRSIWVYLMKLDMSNVKLGVFARERLDNLSSAYPEWKMANNESDEFPGWIGTSGDPDFEAELLIDEAPTDQRELVKWLKSPSQQNRRFDKDNWRDLCRSDLSVTVGALRELAGEGIWPTGRWQEALYAWGESGQLPQFWEEITSVTQGMPSKDLEKIVYSVAWWLEKISTSVNRNEVIVLNLCVRVLDLPLKSNWNITITQNGKPINKPVTEAINHPIGHITQALLNLWFKRKPNDNDGLPLDLAPIFTRLCDTNVNHFRHGRVLMAAQLIGFFRIDQIWTQQNLLPLLDWEINEVESKAAWEGFLWTPRLYLPLQIAIKSQFFATAYHFADLGEHSGQFASFLTYVALNDVENYTTEDFRKAVSEFPMEGLQKVAQQLYQSLAAAGNEKAEHWNNRIKPFLVKIWPKSAALVNEGLVEPLAQLIIAAADYFNDAYTAIRHWITPPDFPNCIVDSLCQSKLCNRFPGTALDFLSRLIVDQRWPSKQLRDCLNAIIKASPALQQDSRYIDLDRYLRRHNI